MGRHRGGLDRRSGTPLHSQVRAVLLGIIADKRAAGPGTRLFTEEEIAARCGVHRLTARQAIQSLVGEGLVYRVRGAGTFLAGPKVSESLDRITNFLEDWPSQGRSAEIRVLEFGRRVAPGAIAQALDVEGGTPVLAFTRLRLVDGVPLALDYRWARPEVENAFDPQRLAREPIQTLLTRALGLRLRGSEIEIEAVTGTVEEAARLGTTPGAPLLLRRVRLLDAGGRPLVVGHSLQRADLFKYRVFVPRDDADRDHA
jgi:GntR family transcriptional regulator